MFTGQAACMEYTGANPSGGGARIPSLFKAIQQAVANKPGNGSGNGTDGGPGVGSGLLVTAEDGQVGLLPSVNGRELPVAMVNPYKPIRDTRSPVAGINAPYGHLRDRRFYGFGNVEAVVFNGEKPFAPLGLFDPPSIDETYPQTTLQSPSRLEMILRTIQTTLPATISALRKQPYYNPAAPLSSQTVYGQPIPYSATEGAGSDVGARAGSALGNIGDTIGAIIRDHPYMTLAAGAGVILLFMKPPRRR